ncbi:transcription factor Rsv2 [Schizosaccharomyces octosporus yFS286]|uniref:Transcription factor Rsv2 n=1 Tax=Schizosaccharomyces octosporus (strain yFS286) TaxID=483514 RepID=S9PSU3_SCHOY|nr:transcription factor Rsv2 [Schizosaccharomyces octosporus yFS286]EPX71037.1 transcription factor Rsv2 [Schizosaccharomyces octosporus yFS286]
MDTTEKSQSRAPSKTTNNEPYGSNWRLQESQLTSNSPLKNNKQTIPSVFPNVFSDTDFDQLSSNGMDLKRLDPNAKESMDPSGYPDMSSWDYMMNVPIRVYNEAEGMDPFTLDTIQDSTMDLSLDPMSADYAHGGNFASAPSSLGSNPAFVTTPSNGSNENNSLPTSNDLDVPLSPSANADYNAAAATQNMSAPPPLTPSLPAVNDSSFSNTHMQLPSQVMPDGTGSIPNVDGNPFGMDPPSLEAGLLSSQQVANGINNNDPAMQNYHFRQQQKQPQQQKSAPPPVPAPVMPSSPISLKQEQTAVPSMFPSADAKDSSALPVKQEEFGLSPKNYQDQAVPAPPNLSQAFQMYSMNQNLPRQPNMSMNGDGILDYNAYPVRDASLDYPTVQRSQALAEAADSLLPSSPSANAEYGSQALDGVSDMLPSQMQNSNQFPQESLPPPSNHTYPIPINNSYRPKRPSLVLGSMNSLSPTQPPVVVPSNTTLSPSPTSTSPMKNSFANGGFASLETTKPQASVVEPPPAPPLANMSPTEQKEDHPVAAAASVAASGEKDSIPVDTTPTPSATTSAGTQRKRRKFKFGKQAGPVRCTLPNRTTGETCNTVFSRTYDLIRHQDTIHAKTRPVFRCEICGDQRHFSRHDALVRHLRVKHGR